MYGWVRRGFICFLSGLCLFDLFVASGFVVWIVCLGGLCACCFVCLLFGCVGFVCLIDFAGYVCISRLVAVFICVVLLVSFCGCWIVLVCFVVIALVICWLLRVYGSGYLL